ncbi:GNAT family N-acetyltransferase [Pantoea sp. Acro-805]|uniref:GNAT family N-acetyltransferase n=1 Tax=Candidatus Pantoea formicae TaxID=2608355 RepID=A0ABX0QSP3_9GAMM|nr:GNAT family protein [Pantoea formicae]NIE98777.1 GNAT family N-acetyltransferase [Pantoea formicae]
MTQLNQYGQPVGIPLPDWQPLAAPPAIALDGRFCTLVPLSAAHSAALFDAFSRAPDDRDWTWLGASKPTSLAEMENWVSGKCHDSRLVSYAVIDHRTQQAVGAVCFANIDGQNGAIEIGHVTWSPLMQRNVLGSEAIFLLLQQAFQLGYRRVAWRCDSTNLASRRAAERLGFTFEGCFRQAMTRKQRNRDTDWLSIIDSEWSHVRQALTAWMSPQNMDNSGCEQLKLRAYFANESKTTPLE